MQQIFAERVNFESKNTLKMVLKKKNSKGNAHDVIIQSAQNELI
jgi:hypothetical protein